MTREEIRTAPIMLRYDETLYWTTRPRESAVKAVIGGPSSHVQATTAVT